MAKMTKVTKKKFLDTYRTNGGSVTNTCEVIGISRNCYYEALGKDRIFENIINEIKEKHDEELIKLAKDGLKFNLKRNFQSAIEYTLNNKCKGEYSNTNKTELTGADGSPLTVIIEKTYEQLKEQIK